MLSGFKNIKKNSTPNASSYNSSFLFEFIKINKSVLIKKAIVWCHFTIGTGKFLQESIGAEYVGFIGGLPLIPNFDELSKEGMLFTNLYPTVTRSVRGIEAVSTGFLPHLQEVLLNLVNLKINFSH